MTSFTFPGTFRNAHGFNVSFEFSFFGTPIRNIFFGILVNIAALYIIVFCSFEQFCFPFAIYGINCIGSGHLLKKYMDFMNRRLCWKSWVAINAVFVSFSLFFYASCAAFGFFGLHSYLRKVQQLPGVAPILLDSQVVL
jgi:hypothetical protein